MKEFAKQSLAVSLNIALFTNQLLADLPPISFDSAEWVPFQSVGGTPGWSLTAGSAEISATGAGINGGKSLRLPVNSLERAKITRDVTWDADEKTAFIDLQIKPAADPSGSFSTFSVNGTQLAFQVPAGASRGEIWVLNGSDHLESPNVNPQQWIKTAGGFDVSGTAASSYFRVTLRHDYFRNLWDFFIDGKLVAVNLAFEGRGANLKTIDFYGSAVGDTLIDDLSAQTVNMLFLDTDKDGLPDSWEIANGSNPFLYDRDAINPVTGKSFLDSYLDSLWPTGTTSTNASNIVPPSVGIPPLGILSQHQAVGALKGSLSVGGDGSASYSVPIDLPKGTGGMEPKLSLNYSSSGGAGIMGLGWSLGGLQAITRGPSTVAKDGAFDPMDFDSNDRFFLDGERLVCVAGTYGAPGSEYRTEMDSYARITAIGGTLGAGPATWKVETKAGLIVTFGGTANAKIAVAQGTLSWAANRVQDTLGNYYQINYTRDAATTVFDFVNQRVSSIDYTGNDSQGLAPYCHAAFDYETRPDVSRSYSKYAGSSNTLRLSQIRVLTGTDLNHIYRLSYDTSYQSQRSRLISIGKEIPGAVAAQLPPTLFNYDGITSTESLWRDPGTSTLPAYGTDLDATSEVNSTVSVEGTNNTTVRLSGDVARAYDLPGAGVTLYSDSRIQFDFKSQNQVLGAMIGLDNDLSYQGASSSPFYRIGGTGTIALSSSSNFTGPTQAYSPAENWKTFNLPIGTLGTGLKNHLFLMCADNESSDGYDDASFSNIRIYRSGSQVPADVQPISFTHGTELPRFSDASGKDLGVVVADLDSDGLPDIADWRAVTYNVTSGSGFQPLVADTNGQTYRNLGNDFLTDSSIRPPAFLPLGCRSVDAAYPYIQKHHLLAQQMDIDGDGSTDLMGSLDVKRVSGQIKNQYGFYSLVNGVWTEKAGWRLPFSFENTSSSVETGGNRRDEHFQWVDLNSDGYLDLVVHTTSSGRLYDAATGALLIAGNVGIAYINKGINGPGWTRDDSRKIPEPLMEGQQDVGRRLLDLDGDGVVEMAESSIYSGALRSKTYQMTSTGSYRWNSVAGLENPPACPFDFPVALAKHDNGYDQGVSVMDVNGDGLPDLLQSQMVGSTMVQKTWLNQGSRTSTPWQSEIGKYRPGYILHYASGDSRIPYGFEIGDLNGDGLPDMLYSDIESTSSGTGAGNNLAILNTGNGWQNRAEWGLPGAERIFTTASERSNGKRRARLQDLNGDGFPDLITGLLDTTPKVWYNNCRPEVLKSVTDGFGSTLTVNYNRLNDPSPIPGFNSRVYEKNFGILTAGQASIIDSRLVVSSYSEPNGNGGTNTKYQRYGGLRYDRINEASLGFGWIEAMDSFTGQVSRTETCRDYPFGGSPRTTTTTVLVTAADLDAIRLPGVTVGTKCLLSETATYADLSPTGPIRRPVQTGSVKTLCDLKGKEISVTITTQALADFDEYGFVKSSTVEVKKSIVDSLAISKVVTTNMFTHVINPTKWYLGRLDTSTVTKSGPGKPDIIKSSSFAYHSTTGLLVTETVEPGNTLSVSKSYIHDGFGNVISTTVSASGETPRTATSGYDSAGRFLLWQRNALNQTASNTYDTQRALLLSTTDIGGLTAQFFYDPYGTLIRTLYPNGTETGEITGWATNASLPANVSSYLSGQIKFFRAKQSSGSPSAKVYLDSLGRELCTESTVLRNAAISSYSQVYSVTRYDARGRKDRVSDTFAAGETPQFTFIYYDFLNRVINTAHPDNTSDYVKTFDNFLLNDQPVTYSKTVNRDGKALERWEDLHGRLIQSSDPSGQTTTFFHDHEGRLLNVKIDGQTLLTNTFDLFGNKTAVNEVNSGSSSSVYNAYGEVESSTNAKGQTTDFSYDILGRPTSISKPEGTYQTYYDGAIGNGIGKAWKTTGPDGYSEEVVYDGYGRAINTRKTQFGETFTTSSTFDALGRVYSETNAGGLSVIHDYDASSFPVALRIAPGTQPGAGTLLWQAGTFDSKGRSLTQTLAQGVTASASYVPTTGQLSTLTGTDAYGALLQNKSCTWDSLGNLSSRSDAIAKRVESFGYDTLNRVTSASTVLGAGATTTALPPPENYSYATNGNLMSKAGASLTYGGSRPHAVSSATIKGETRNYTYDAAGYVTNDSKRDYSWSSFGQLRALDYLAAPALQNLAGTEIYAAARVQTDFTFDAGGNRAKQLKKRIAPNSSRELEETLYLGSYEREIRMTQANGSATPLVTKITHRHTLGGLGVYTQTISPTGTETKLSTLLKDHLGSTDVIYTGKWSSVSNAFITPTTERQAFDPWGERRNADTFQTYRLSSADPYRTTATDYDRGYTGHEQLDDSGLIHMNGRIYDPELGRMLSPDPVVQVPTSSQNYNRYSYVLNNPLNLTDPSGFSFFSRVLGGFGIHTALNNWTRENWRTVVVIVVVAVLTYFTAGAASGWATATYASLTTTATGVATAASATAAAVGGAVAGAYIGAVAGGLSAALNGGDLGDVLRGAAIGAVQGAITGGVLHGLDQGAGVYNAQTAVHIAGHGVVGGAANVAMGGKFGDGFVSAAVSAAAGDAGLYGGKGGGAWGVARRTIMAGVVGGTASALGGGKFANGAYTAAFQHLLNFELVNVYKGFVPLDADAPQSSALFPSYKNGYQYDYKNDLTAYSYEILPCTDLPIQDASGDLFAVASFFFGGGEIAAVQAGTRRAFWSGIGANVAAKEASALGLRTLETTFLAKILMATQRFLPRSFVDNSWTRLSSNWAAGSNGAAHFFGPLGEGAVRVGSTWE
ncbi:MAG: RHS repeat-associated core domain-containing protein, partial [Luteolibacter sp.]